MHRLFAPHYAPHRVARDPYPLGLAMVGELVEGTLRSHASSNQARQRAELSVLVLSVFDRYPIPSALGQAEWSEARAELARRLDLVGMHAPKWVKDIPDAYAKVYWDLMPSRRRFAPPIFPPRATI
jgi:hypothetical protein